MLEVLDDTFEICQANVEDADEILDLQKRAYSSEAKIYNNFTIPPLKQSIEAIQREFQQRTFLKVVHEDEIIGSVRAFRDGDTCYIGRLIVDDEYQNMGIGKSLMRAAENLFTNVDRYELFTGCKSEKNLYLYEKLGYTIFKRKKYDRNLTLVYMEKYV